MTNLIQRMRLKIGIEAWNTWRKKNPDIRIDFNRANLRYANVSDANFSDASLSHANLSHANLSGANLSGANLSDANLSGVNLISANLIGANLRNEFQVGLEGVNLSYANLSHANLIGAEFRNANLSHANLSHANLSGADLSRAVLSGVYIEDWNINSATNLKQVICDYIYFKRNQQKRLPSDPDRNFDPGEFVELVNKSIYTVDLIFEEGIDWKAFLSLFQDLQVEYDEQNVSIQAIEKKSDGTFIIRLNVPSYVNKAKIETEAKQLYETKVKMLEAYYRSELQAKDEQINIYRQHNTDLLDIIKLKAIQPIQNIIDITSTAGSKYMSDTFNTDNTGANITNYANQVKDNARLQAKQYNYAPEQKQSPAEAAAEIQKLLKQLEKTNPDATPEQQQAYVDAAISPSIKERCIGALKAGGEAAIEEFLDNPYVNVGKAVIKSWIEP